MTEATMDQTDASEMAALEQAAKQIDFERMKQIGSYHFAMVMGALTLYGAAETWAQVSGWSLARFAAFANVAGYVISSVIHEWGHFAGARLSGAKSPVLEKPAKHFFMFDFDMAANDVRQFLSMSWGGILAPWLAVVLALVLVPLSTVGAAALIATLVMRALAATVFEAPIARKTAESGDPSGELGKALAAGTLAKGRNVGALVGALVFAVAWALV